MKFPAHRLQVWTPTCPFAAWWPHCRPSVCKALLCLVLCAPSFAVVAQTSPNIGSSAASTEERVKAVFLYKFLSYVEWPPSAFAANDSPYVIGIFDDDIADELSRISANRKLNNRALTVRKLRAGDPLNGVHVLFYGERQTDAMLHGIKQAQRQPILVVTETEGALAQGSMINFRIVDDRVRFEISVDSLEKSGLKISSRLLEVAISVTKGSKQ